MNWKNVIFLLRVERKSGRLIRGVKTTKYRENRFLAYWPYWLALIIGIVAGLIANFVVSSVYSNPSSIPNLPPLVDGSLSVFVTLPTILLVFSFVFTLLQQIQVAGIKATGQVMYWLPITWQEQTLASILSNLLGFPIAIVIGTGAGIIIFGAFNGLILQSVLTTLALLAAAFMASASTEILRLVQMRFIGAVYKSSGRAAIWVRLIGTLFFFLVFYILYFYVIYGSVNFFSTLSQVQQSVWFVPFIWLALTISYFFSGIFLQGLLFAVSSALFIAALYYLAVLLNQRFGLYEPPAITVQKSGVYAPKTGLLGKLGFSTVEAAIIRKDFRAFTRRREMVSIFIVPIVLILLPLMQSLGISNPGTPTSQVDPIFSGIIFLLPCTFMAVLLGEILIGEEGQAVWRIYASPISPKNLVRSKYFFLIIFSTIMLFISGSIGIVFYHPPIQQTIAAFVEGFLIVLAVGGVALTVGFKGPDFSQSRRARMVRQEWSLIGLLVCAIAAGAVVAPLVFAVGLAFFIGGAIGTLDLAIGVAISAAISLAITIIFYRINLGIAVEFLKKAQI
jgi:hypothetical protein